jgi:hypothetical protein
MAPRLQPAREVDEQRMCAIRLRLEERRDERCDDGDPKP